MKCCKFLVNFSYSTCNCVVGLRIHAGIHEYVKAIKVWKLFRVGYKLIVDIGIQTGKWTNRIKLKITSVVLYCNYIYISRRHV